MIGTTLNQRFALEKELGRGGMGTVYRATDLILQRTVAIKVLKEIGGEEVGRRIRLEAQITARLEHQNVVRLYDFGVDVSVYYFIMEEVDGTSFQKRWKKVELPQRVSILAQVADALDYAHHKGLIHRDVKPGNVLLTSSDLAKLSDFGLSLDASEEQESGIVSGTPHYMSPEQAKGKKLDHRTDIYALGVMLYECATGAPPFQGTLTSIMSQHVNADPEAPRFRNPQISEEFERFINRMMSKSPERRPASCAEAAAELRRLVAEDRLLTSGGGIGTPVSIVPVDPKSGAVTPRSPATGMGAVPSSKSVTALPSVSSERATRLVSVIRGTSLDARDMIDAVEEEPIRLSADDRYLCGHYLAYLIGGSRRQGFLRQRPLDPLNADRARLMLAMAYVGQLDGSEEAIARAARLLDERPDVRPAMSPIVVAKYLAARDTPPKRKKFRQNRQRLQDASAYAAAHLCDEQGVLNPGLMPQRMSDMNRLAPERSEVDDQLVQRWNRVTEVWRGNPQFRDAVLRYATKAAYRDPSSVDLWPEVVYPLIERARWQRRLRSGTEKVLDAISAPLHLPQAGTTMDRMIRQSVPEAVVAKLDVSLDVFEEDPSLGDAAPAVDPDVERLSLHHLSAQNLVPEDEDVPTRDFVRLSSPEPVRLTQGELRTLWQEGLAALRQPGTKAAHRNIPIGPYRIAVVASIRSRSAGQVAIQGMPNKQIEMLVPSFTGGGGGTRPTIAAWTYTNHCLVVTYTDHTATQKYILWDSGTAQQHNFEHAADLNHQLFQMGLEVPDSLDRVLSKSYRPKNAV